MGPRILGAAVLLVLASTASAAEPLATWTPTGTPDFPYGSGGDSSSSQATGSKPESKLLYTHDGRWWAVLSTSLGGPSGRGVHLFELVDHSWVARVKLPLSRPSHRADTLLLGRRLFVALRDTRSRRPRSGLYRLRYLGDGRWGRVEGPTPITGARVEALTIARDSRGRLWTAFDKKNGRIRVGHTRPRRTRFFFQTVSRSRVDGDDIAAVISYGRRIGVMWSDRHKKRYWFAWRRDGAPVTTGWHLEKAFGGGAAGCAASRKCANDHISLRSYRGRVVAVVKTALPLRAPRLVLLRRNLRGRWKSFRVTSLDFGSRPTLLLAPSLNRMWVFAQGGGHKDVYVWTSRLRSPNFRSSRRSWIQTEDGWIREPTTTKQNITARTGAVVVASLKNRSEYWHNELLPAGP